MELNKINKKPKSKKDKGDDEADQQDPTRLDSKDEGMMTTAKITRS